MADITINGYPWDEKQTAVAINFTATVSGSSQVVDKFPDTFGNMTRWDYAVSKGTHGRGGSIIAFWDPTGTSVEYAEYSSPDVGSSSDVTLAVTNAASTIELKMAAGTSGWSMDVLRYRL